MTDPSIHDLDACGCCEPASASAAEPIANKPGLDALRYRSATHPRSLQRMVAALPQTTIDGGRPLADLTARAPDDPSIALLDAFATVADVLSFYQERIVNEGFLRTATERRSVLELAREIGYELRPGVAASTFLAFTIDDAAPAPQAGAIATPGSGVAAGTATVPAGTKVQSIPAKGGLPQTFETSEPIEGRAAWNGLRPRLQQPQPLDPEASTIFLDGTTTALEAGDLVLFVTAANGSTTATHKMVVGVTVEAALGRTKIDLDNLPREAPPYAFVPNTYASATIIATPLISATVQSYVVGGQWKEDEFSAFMAIQGWSPLAVEQTVATGHKTVPSGPPAIDDPPLPGVYEFRAQVATFGHNAPRWASLPSDQRIGDDVAYSDPWDGTDEPSILNDSSGHPFGDPAFFLERTVDDIVPGSWVMLERSNRIEPYRVASSLDRSLADFAISARVTGLTVVDPAGGGPTGLTDFKMRSTTVHAASRPLALAGLPIEATFGKGTPESSSLTLDSMVLGLTKDRPVVITGERSDLPGVVVSEAVVLSDIVHSGGLTTLFFGSELENTYVRSTASINANVARATHGETVDEVLGSGDAARPNQRFALKRPPLTHTAGGAGGARSTLQLRVNDILWAQMPSLYPAGPRDQAYIVRIDDDQSATVVFGDGENGARPGTGVENVTARYRTGIGLAGLVPAASLTLLQTRPPGVRGVTNPVAASGAADPESLADARVNAPLTVLAFGRIVSLRDYEDFVAAFAGIGKAQAVDLREGERSLVHVTIAGFDGAQVPGASDLYRALVDEVAASSDPIRRFRIDSYQRVFFHVAASIRIDAHYRPDAVIGAVRDALGAAFSFARRGFGQPVSAAEVVTTIQGVAGVEAVDLDALFRVDDAANPPAPTLATILPAEQARRVGGDLLPAQLLLVNPFGIVVVDARQP